MKKLIYIFFIFIFLAFKADHYKSGYNVPISPLSVCILDIDLDNDKDIIFSHMYSFDTELKEDDTKVDKTSSDEKMIMSYSSYINMVK